MCLICIEWEKGKLTLEEALRNYREIAVTLEPDHAEEVADKLQIELMKEWLAQNLI